ncbi:MAG TPA: SCO family protein [Hyphomicrobiales bacterium]|nr:SCO family protein [Hyphomicrobiales bacterium]
MITRRAMLSLTAAGACAPLLAACQSSTPWHGTDISGSLPQLDFTLTRASDGKIVHGADYRGKVALVYFGYTFCPDLCPTTLQNLTLMLQTLGPLADRIRVLFVTVDPNRDTETVLKQYVSSFAPQTVGLRGTPDQLAAFAKRCRVAYSVTPAKGDQPYQVTHSSVVYVFDATGKARLLFSDLSTPKPDLAGTEADLRRLAAAATAALPPRHRFG